MNQQRQSIVGSISQQEKQEQVDLWYENHEITSSYLYSQISTLINQKDATLLSIYPFTLTSLKEYIISTFQQEWEKLYQTCSTSIGKKISKNERKKLGINNSNFVYGEISFKALAEILYNNQYINLKNCHTFYDLGSGTGRAIFAASYIHNFRKLCGIEILQGLHQEATKIKNRYDQDFLSTRPYHLKNQDISFIRASFLDIDITDADIIFINSTCFGDELVYQIEQLINKMKKGTYLISMTRKFDNTSFTLISSESKICSWGVATAHIHQKQS